MQPVAALSVADPSLRDRSPEAVARELQVVFLTQLLQALRRTVPDSGLLPRSPGHDVYEGVFDRSVAESMARRDPLGLVGALAPVAAPNVLKSLERSADISSEPPLPDRDPHRAGGPKP